MDAEGICERENLLEKVLTPRPAPMLAQVMGLRGAYVTTVLHKRFACAVLESSSLVINLTVNAVDVLAYLISYCLTTL